MGEVTAKSHAREERRNPTDTELMEPTEHALAPHIVGHVLRGVRRVPEQLVSIGRPVMFDLVFCIKVRYLPYCVLVGNTFTTHDKKRSFLLCRLLVLHLEWIFLITFPFQLSRKNV